MLTAVRVTVASADRDAYRETVAALAARHAARGLHLWLFELQGTDGIFLEFSEGKGVGHRTEGPADEVEAGLEGRLTELGHYARTGERWDEVRLDHHPKE